MPTWFNDKNIELYEFAQGEAVQRYTSGRKNVIHNGFIYAPKNIERDTIKTSTDIFQNKIKLTLPIDDDLAQTYIGTTVEEVIQVRILGKLSGEFAYIWQGRLVSSVTDGSEVELNCEEITTQQRRMGLTPTFQHGCRHALYSPMCGLNKDDYATSATIESIDGREVMLTALSQEDGYFNAGIFKVGSAYRYITAHEGNKVVLSRMLPADLTETACTLYAGCSHSTTVCEQKFNNLDNFGGFPYLDKNPFEIGNIYNKV